jgi:hypothetical protein
MINTNAHALKYELRDKELALVKKKVEIVEEFNQRNSI